MKLNLGILSAALLIPAVVAAPISTLGSTTSDNSQTKNVHLQRRSLGNALANFGIAAGATTLLIGTGLGFSEWALNWYSRLLRDRRDSEKLNQTQSDDRAHREKQWARRERAMELMLEMAENYSDRIAADEEFDGNFEPLSVPTSIVGAIENVFEQTSEVEGMDGIGSMQSLDGLKGALKPLLDLEKTDERSGRKVKEREYPFDEVMPPIPSIPPVSTDGLRGSPTANHRFRGHD